MTIRLEHRETPHEWIVAVWPDGFEASICLQGTDVVRVQAPPTSWAAWWIKLDLSGRVIAHGHSWSVKPDAETLARVAEAGPAIVEAVRPVLMDAMEPVYIRFGELPAGGLSRNWATGELEPGVSCYRARRRVDGGYELVSSGLPYAAIAAAMGAYGNTVLLIAGEECGRGSDGEPCLRNVRTLARLQYRDGRFAEL